MVIVNMVWTVLWLIIRFAVPIVVLGSRINVEAGSTIVVVLGTLVSFAVGIGLQIYFLIVVKSYYNKLKGHTPTPQII